MRSDVEDSVIMEYNGLAEIQEVSKKILIHADEYRIMLFIGDLGAGKTTLIKALCRELNVTDVVSSPTFSLINEYQTESGEDVYHFDFYRIKDEYEAYDIGVEEYFYSEKYCFVEWPSKIPNLLPERYMKIKINPLDENKRQLVIYKNEEA